MTEDLTLHYEVSQFLAHEADLLDLGNFQGWIELFAENAIYWLPCSSDQTDMHGQVSIILEDVPLLKLRVARLSHPRAYSVTPPPATTHMVGNVTAERGQDYITVHSKIILNQIRDDVSSSLSGNVTHHLLTTDSGFKILLKRVDLIGADGTFNVLSIPI